jgi:hypothetical protein
MDKRKTSVRKKKNERRKKKGHVIMTMEMANFFIDWNKWQIN